MPVDGYQDALHDVTSELDEALDQIRHGQCNQGIERWERCFLKGHSKLNLVDLLYLKSNLADVLVECGLVDSAKHFDRQIAKELTEDEDKECPLVGEVDRVQLDEERQRRYTSKSESSTFSEQGNSIDNKEYIEAGRPAQAIPSPKSSSQPHRYFTRSRSNLQKSQNLSPFGRKGSEKEAKDKAKVATPDLTRIESPRHPRRERHQPSAGGNGRTSAIAGTSAISGFASGTDRRGK